MKTASSSPANPSSPDQPLDRRKFLAQAGAAAVAAGAFPAGVRAVDAGDEIKVALIGCGGRGTGAASQALQADDNVKLWAMADTEAEQLDRSHQTLEKGGKISRTPEGVTFADKMDVPSERRLIGLDAFDRVMQMDDIDVVILTTPPGFRPIHFEAAVRAGKHVFMEKPVAVDGPGVRQVVAAAAEAKEKNLKVGVGLNRRHSPMHEELIPMIHDGRIGDVRTIRQYNCRGGVGKHHTRLPDETELQYQVRHWYYFTWLSGDFIVEQSVHDYDVTRWIKGDINPVKCQGQGGRLVRDSADKGQIYDHFYVEYDFADESKLITQHRHIAKCWNFFGSEIDGDLGRATLAAKSRTEIKLWGADRPVHRAMESGNSYQVEHDRLFKAIRDDLPHNEAERGAYASLMAIMGRDAAYTGRPITWEEALNSEVSLVKDVRDWNDEPPTLPDKAGRYLVAKPG